MEAREMKNRTSTSPVFLILLLVFFIIPSMIGVVQGYIEDIKEREALEQERRYWEEINAIIPGDGVSGEYTFICYNENLKTYDNNYSTWWNFKDYDYAPKTADEVGAILYYSSAMKEEKLYYSYYPIFTILTEEEAEKYAEIWKIEELTVRLVDRSSGKILAKETFVAEPPESVSADAERIATVSHIDVGNWVLTNWKDK